MIIRFIADWCFNIAETYVIFLICDLLNSKKVVWKKNVILLAVVSLTTLGLQKFPYFFKDDITFLTINLMMPFFGCLAYFAFYFKFIGKTKLTLMALSTLLCILTSFIVMVLFNIICPQDTNIPNNYSLSLSFIYYATTRIFQAFIIYYIGWCKKC